MAEMRRDQAHHLASYGWVNEATKTAHVPIDRAIELQLQKGFPVAAPQGAAQPSVPVPDQPQPPAPETAPIPEPPHS
jgi:hypothetical protein